MHRGFSLRLRAGDIKAKISRMFSRGGAIEMFSYNDI